MPKTKQKAAVNSSGSSNSTRTRSSSRTTVTISNSGQDNRGDKDKQGTKPAAAPNDKLQTKAKGQAAAYSTIKGPLEDVPHKRHKARGVALKNRRKLAAGKDGPKRKSKPKRTFKIYIFKVLKGMRAEMSISTKAMDVMNSIAEDLLEKLATEAGQMCKIAKKQTMGLPEAEAATKLCLHGELRAHALLEGRKALTTTKAKKNKE